MVWIIGSGNKSVGKRKKARKKQAKTVEHNSRKASLRSSWLQRKRLNYFVAGLTFAPYFLFAVNNSRLQGRTTDALRRLRKTEQTNPDPSGNTIQMCNDPIILFANTAYRFRIESLEYEWNRNVNVHLFYFVAEGPKKLFKAER